MFIAFALKLQFVVRSPHIRGKLIYYVPSENHTRTTQRDQGAHCTRVYRT